MKKQELIWSKKLLDGGKGRTQTEWVAFLKETEWRLPTVQEYLSLFETNTATKKQVWNTLKRSPFYVMTATKINKRALGLGVNNNDRFFINADDVTADYVGRPALGVKK